MLGSYALLLQSPTNSSRLWDKAVNCKSSSSHTNPLCCPESIKGSYNPLLRPEASSHAVLRIQTWGVALGRSGPFCNPVSSTSWVGAAVQGQDSGESLGWKPGGRCAMAPRSTQGQLPACGSPASSALPASPYPFLSGPTAAASRPTSLPLFEYMTVGKTSYHTRNRGVLCFFKVCFCAKTKRF